MHVQRDFRIIPGHFSNSNSKTAIGMTRPLLTGGKIEILEAVYNI